MTLSTSGMSHDDMADPDGYQVLRPDGTLRDENYVAPSGLDADLRLSFDHRIIDGVHAGRFPHSVQQALEDWDA